MDETKFGINSSFANERATLIKVTLVAPTPQEAYKLAYQKYRNNFKLLSAKQIYNEKKREISCEIVVAMSKKNFLNFDTIKEDIQTLFLQKGLTEEAFNTIVKSLDSAVLGNKEELVTAILQKIDTSLCIQDENITDTRVKIFVGPTGVGKTTTIAKLASRYSSMMGKKERIALINLDSFKVGAFEQLAHFAKLLHLQHFPISTLQEFEEVYNSLINYDMILIDTTGISPYDTKKLIKTVEYLGVDKRKNIEVNLVLSTTVKYEDIQAIHETFSFLNINTIILSKFDETKYFGTIISYLLTHSLPLSYFTIGQNFPEDIRVANKEYILEQFIGEF